MTQLTVTIQDPTKVSLIRKFLQNLEGVTVTLTQLSTGVPHEEGTKKKVEDQNPYPHLLQI